MNLYSTAYILIVIISIVSFIIIITIIIIYYYFSVNKPSIKLHMGIYNEILYVNTEMP